ncbi:NAD-dependent dehydratase [Pseudomarimonas arenosa]|uniref:NAD-dependent dehydratase n=1 Tax=Pseudomarimonas arenosa TaxID=2774145 RepID=A0AAW3ZIN1_9GAMM|nr:NAD-dependent dehydratase [Pseudomarimonas arenosa]MBD8524997.1 NAD-dependent dehydratase [Pseudomarimonas arenosa]
MSAAGGGAERSAEHSGLMLLGGSGLVGTHFLQALLANSRGVSDLWLPLRRAIAAPSPPCHRLPIDPDQAASALRDASQPVELRWFVSCFGTTRRQAGSAEAFVAIDRDLVLAWAKRARALGATHALLVSSIGADVGAANLYLRTKGELEQALSELGFNRIDLLRPGLLIGRRNGPARPAEALGQWLAPLFDHALLGGLRRYRSISAAQVAAALLALLNQGEPGVFVHLHDQLVELARAFERC